MLGEASSGVGLWFEDEFTSNRRAMASPIPQVIVPPLTLGNRVG
jgi:hypothetical protein